MVSRSLARLAAVRFAEPWPRVFLAELFSAFVFFMEASVRIARPNGASIVGATAPVKSKWQIGHQSSPSEIGGSHRLAAAESISHGFLKMLPDLNAHLS